MRVAPGQTGSAVVTTRLATLAAWFARRAENIAALMLAAMFAVFLLQIAFRYLLGLPIGWTHEVSVLLWVWLVLFGAAFVVREREEIRFDLLYGAVRPAARRLMSLVAALTLVVVFTMSLPAVWSYVTFMRVERTAYLKIRFDVVFSIYVAFAVAMILRYLWLAWRAVRGGPEAAASGSASSGL